MTSSPTCLFINNSPQPGRKHLAKLGGGGKSLLSLLSLLPRQGWNTHVVVPGEGQFTDELIKMGIAHTVYPFRPIEWRRPLETLSTTRAWRALCQRIKPTLVHANGFDLSRSFALAAGSLRIPYITHVRFPVEPVGIRWTLRGLPRPAAFIFNSHAMLNALWPQIHPHTPRSNAYAVHNAVDLESFTPAPWPMAPPYRLGIVANFARFKRHEDFLRMAADMVKVRQDLEFLIIGDDTEGTGRRGVLEQLAIELGVMPYVKFLGHRSDIPAIMHQLHLLVVPSQFEPFGRVVIEAMACRRPVIGSRDGGIPEIIDDGKTGSLVEVGDHAGFARAALDLIGNRARWESFSRGSVEAVRQRFSIQAHTKNILDIYGEVLERTSSPTHDFS